MSGIGTNLLKKVQTKLKGTKSFENETEEEKELISIFLYNAECGNVNIIKKMFRNAGSLGQKLLNGIEQEGRTSLHLASFNGSLALVQFLVENGANVNAIDKMGWNVTHFAAYNGKIQVLEYLLTIESIQILPNRDGNTPFHYLCRTKCEENCQKVVELLLKKNVDINYKNNNGETALHNSCWGSKEMMNLLISKGANVNVKNRAGETPLHWCARQGNSEMVLCLLKAGADIHAQSNTGLFPIDVSAASDLIRKLLSVNTPNLPELIQKKNPLIRADSLPNLANIKPLEWESKPDISQDWTIDPNEMEFLEKLGSGSYAKVYKANYRGEEVAVKVMKKINESIEERENFLKEFEVMRSVRSPYVAYLYGIVLDPTICIVMKYFSNGSLYHVLERNFNMNWELVLKISLEIAHCVNCLHSWKPQIIHGDLKTLNLLVEDDWKIRISDFGLSTFISNNIQSTLGKLKGTFAYCAPEIYNEGSQFTTKSDIYSLGIVLWEVVNRCIKGVYEKPFGEYSFLKKDFQILFQSAKKGLRPTLSRACPPSLKELIEKLWSHNSEDRPSIREILTWLKTTKDEYGKNMELKINWDTGREFRQMEKKSTLNHSNTDVPMKSQSFNGVGIAVISPEKGISLNRNRSVSDTLSSPLPVLTPQKPILPEFTKDTSLDQEGNSPKISPHKSLSTKVSFNFTIQDHSTPHNSEKEEKRQQTQGHYVEKLKSCPSPVPFEGKSSILKSHLKTRQRSHSHNSSSLSKASFSSSSSSTSDQIKVKPTMNDKEIETNSNSLKQINNAPGKIVRSTIKTSSPLRHNYTTSISYHSPRMKETSHQQINNSFTTNQLNADSSSKSIRVRNPTHWLKQKNKTFQSKNHLPFDSEDSEEDSEDEESDSEEEKIKSKKPQILFFAP